MSKKKTKQIGKYAQELALGATKREAKLAVGLHPETPTVRLEDNEVFRVAQKSLIRAMEKVGITDELIAKRIHQLLTKKHVVLSWGKKVTVASTDTVAVAKALEHIAKIRGDFEPLEVKHTNPLAGIPIGQLLAALQAQEKEGNVNVEMLPELTQ